MNTDDGKTAACVKMLSLGGKSQQEAERELAQLADSPEALLDCTLEIHSPLLCKVSDLTGSLSLYGLGPSNTLRRIAVILGSSFVL